MDEIEVSEAKREEIVKMLQDIRSNDTNPEKLQSLLEKWDKDFGPKYNDIAVEILHDILRKNAVNWAIENGVSTAEDIVSNMWEGWTEGEFTIERTDEGIQIHCTKCPHADAYRTIGRKEYGLLFKCSEDPPIVSGINPTVRFQRTKSLMNGDDCCDHHYSDS
ncbi:MAG: L-2-amino-thiazoline-4-carboxylic acid hydrolase [Candidatus Thorarchaeota archaeon]